MQEKERIAKHQCGASEGIAEELVEFLRHKLDGRVSGFPSENCETQSELDPKAP